MPRRKQPPRLWLRRDEGVWIILDGGKHIRTGCRADEREAAEEAYREYLNDKAALFPKKANPAKTTLGEILARYVTDRGPEVKDPERLAYAVQALAPYWGDLTPDDVSISHAKSYQKKRNVSPSTVRRELNVLQAALNYAEKAMRLPNPPKIDLPKAAPPKDRWLTPEEVRRLRLHAPAHLDRFIEISLTTGRRMKSILNLRWHENEQGGWIDLDHGIIHFLAKGEIESRKRKGSVAMTPDLLAAARAWRMDGSDAVIHFRGKPIQDIGTAFDAAAARASVYDATPHTLKHTAVTWAFQAGMTLEDASSYFATSVETLLRTYRQHSPHHNKRAVSIMARVGRNIIADNVADDAFDRIAAE